VSTADKAKEGWKGSDKRTFREEGLPEVGFIPAGHLRGYAPARPDPDERTVTREEWEEIQNAPPPEPKKKIPPPPYIHKKLLKLVRQSVPEVFRGGEQKVTKKKCDDWQVGDRVYFYGGEGIITDLDEFGGATVYMDWQECVYEDLEERLVECLIEELRRAD
jgi:hypothetical protein